VNENNGEFPSATAPKLAAVTGKYSYTVKFKPWELITYLSFIDRSKALSFEKYSKSP